MTDPVKTAEKMLAQLTPRPWKTRYEKSDSGFFRELSVTTDPSPPEKRQPIIDSCGCCDSILGHNIHDAEFFILAPELVETLVDEVKKLRRKPLQDALFAKWNEARKGNMGDTFYHQLARLRDGAAPDSLNALSADVLSRLASILDDG